MTEHTRRLNDTTNSTTKEAMGGIAPSPNGSTSVDIERAWSYIKLLRSESMGIPALFWKNRVCANDMSKAEALREQYENVFTWEDLNNVPILPESHTRIFRILYTFKTRGIQKLLESRRPDKASGPDQIPACVLNESAFKFALILTSLFKPSFDQGALPSTWRVANITAIFKRGHPVVPKNYRPVSLTSLIAKTMEHFICKQICSHLSRNSVISSTRMTPKRTLV